MSDPAARPPIRFGTDGVRGPYGAWPLTEAGVERMGRGIAAWLGEPGKRVVVGRDTRESGPALEDALVRGLVAGGMVALRAGVVPTAAVSCAVVDVGAAAGVMLTASHNAWRDNGVKVVGRDGKKLGTRAVYLEEAFVDPPAPGGGAEATLEDAIAPWKAALPDVDLAGLAILLDAASGAAWHHAADALIARGARVIHRDPAPDGRNINDGTGALHPPTAAEVRSVDCALALCLDGDADRLVLVDAQVGPLDGDDMLWLLGGHGGGPVVGTVMSNGGLEAALGGRLVRAPVGDQHVAAAMVAHQAQVGAEPSGHVLFADGMPTGDGLYTALRVLAALRGADGRPRLPLHATGWARWPLATKDVRFAGPRVPLSQLSAPGAATEAGNRVVVRYSGTEPKLRILVEGTGQGDASPAAWADRIAAEFEAGRAG